MVLIALCGFANSGKDTFSNHLVNNYDFAKFSFASATKDVISNIFGWERNLLEGDTIESRNFRETIDLYWSNKLSIENFTPRKALQLIGTDLFRKHFNCEIWVNIIEKKIIDLLKTNPLKNIIVSDCRFSNEITMLKNLGAKLIHIYRNLPIFFNKYKEEISDNINNEKKNEENNNYISISNLHLSEKEWIKENFDYSIENKFDLIQFKYEINSFIENEFNIKIQTHKEVLSKQFGLDKFTQSDKSKLNWIDSNLLDLIEFTRGFDSFDSSNLSHYYLYTGRGPSQNTLHIGHLLGLELIKSINYGLETKIFFMIADDEKIIRDGIGEKTMEANVANTIKQLNKIGFTDSNTQFHINSKNITPIEYQLMIKLMSLVSIEQLEKIFGKKNNIGEYFYVFYQLVPCFKSFDHQCIVVCGIDQDPFFRLGRFLAKKIRI